jgi:hypothetical protein
MEVPLLDGLAGDRDALAAERLCVGRHLDRVDLGDVAFQTELGRPAHVARIERGMKCREDEAACRLQEPRGRRHHRLDGFHVHDRHVADHRIERRRLAECEESLLVQRVGVPILDVAPVRTSPLEHALAEVGGEHVRARLGHRAGELAVPARDLEDPISRLDAKQVLNRRLDEVSLPGRPGLHALVPIRGQLVPGGADIVVQVAVLAHQRSVAFPASRCRRRTGDRPYPCRHRLGSLDRVAQQPAPGRVPPPSQHRSRGGEAIRRHCPPISRARRALSIRRQSSM